MKLIKLCTTALLMLCFACKSSKDSFKGTPVTGVVERVTVGASPTVPGVIPYTITFDADSIMVTNLPAGYALGSKIKFTYELKDTTLMVLLTADYLRYPKRATLTHVEKQ